jgi:hypothetical protein
MTGDLCHSDSRNWARICTQKARKTREKGRKMASKTHFIPCFDALLGNSLPTRALIREILWLQTLIKWLISGYLSQRIATT